jgi:hypothetical protein
VGTARHSPSATKILIASVPVRGRSAIISQDF